MTKDEKSVLKSGDFIFVPLTKCQFDFEKSLSYL